MLQSKGIGPLQHDALVPPGPHHVIQCVQARDKQQKKLSLVLVHNNSSKVIKELQPVLHSPLAPRDVGRGRLLGLCRHGGCRIARRLVAIFGLRLRDLVEAVVVQIAGRDPFSLKAVEFDGLRDKKWGRGVPFGGDPRSAGGWGKEGRGEGQGAERRPDQEQNRSAYPRHHRGVLAWREDLQAAPPEAGGWIQKKCKKWKIF